MTDHEQQLMAELAADELPLPKEFGLSWQCSACSHINVFHRDIALGRPPAQALIAMVEHIRAEHAAKAVKG